MDDRLSRVFAALADPTRRDLVARLTDGDAGKSLVAAFPTHRQGNRFEIGQTLGLAWRADDAVAIAG